MIEVEIKVKLSPEKVAEIEAFLLGEKFEKHSYVKETDIYYTSDYHDCKKLDEALRVRTVEDLNSGKINSTVTFKGPKLDSISMSRKELETEISNGSVIKEIFESIGFYSVPEVVKTRREFVKDEITVCLDNVEGLGDFMELEIVVPSENEKDNALEKIEGMLGKFGLTWDDTVRKSYLSMLLGQY